MANDKVCRHCGCPESEEAPLVVGSSSGWTHCCDSDCVLSLKAKVALLEARMQETEKLQQQLNDLKQALADGPCLGTVRYLPDCTCPACSARVELNISEPELANEEEEEDTDG